MNSLAQLSRDVGLALERRGYKVVFAESCTAGLVAASLARVAGISNYLCGSAVTYCTTTKSEWLGIPPAVLAADDAVSDRAARQMARQVLAKTPEADIAISVTGHLGPHAPKSLDGVVYVGTAQRRGRSIATSAQRHLLTSHSRVRRQHEAAQLALTTLLEVLT